MTAITETVITTHDANGLRLLLVARLSRKKTGTDRRDGVSIEFQDATAREWAEREGHAVISTAADIKSGTSAPWKRKNLRPWMEDAARLNMYDALLIYRTDRISRGTQEDFTFIEHWAVRHGKRIIVADGPQFPKRDDSDYWRWTAEKDAARKEWEAIRSRSMGTLSTLKASGHAVGRYPFGYAIAGDMYAKHAVIDRVNGPLAHEAFQWIADGRTATSVAEWLSEKTGVPWRTKRVIDMIRRRTYLGERDGHVFEALVCQELWDNANAALAARGASKGGRRTVHGLSSVIYCPCGAPLYCHQGGGSRAKKYRCCRGRRGIATERLCGARPVPAGTADAAVDARMRGCAMPEVVTATLGGDHGRQQRLAEIQDAMTSAMGAKDMGGVTRLAAEYATVNAQSAEAVRTVLRMTGRTYAGIWAAGDLAERRAILGSGELTMTVQADEAGNVRADLEVSEGSGVRQGVCSPQGKELLEDGMPTDRDRRRTQAVRALMAEMGTKYTAALRVYESWTDEEKAAWQEKLRAERRAGKPGTPENGVPEPGDADWALLQKRYAASRNDDGNYG